MNPGTEDGGRLAEGRQTDGRDAERDEDRPLVALTGATGFLGSHIADLGPALVAG